MISHPPVLSALQDRTRSTGEPETLVAFIEVLQYIQKRTTTTNQTEDESTLRVCFSSLINTAKY